MLGKRSLKFLVFLMGVLFLCPWQIYGAPGGESQPFYVIERDTLQTRNFTPVINHETMAINLGNRPITMGIISPIPRDKFRQGKHYPAFLEESLLPDPLFAPIEVSPTKTTYLTRPETITKGDNTSFVWKEATLPAGEALIVQYDNYFGEPDLYWKPEGLEILGLVLHTDYTARRLKESSWELSFDYELINRTGSVLKDLSLDVFVPVRQLSEEKETNFLELSQICTSPNIEASKVTRADGFGEAAYGVTVSLWTENLESNGKVHFSLRLTGSRKAKSGIIWPIVILAGRSLQKPVWPPTVINTGEPVNEGRFSYLSYNLVIQDSRVFVLSPKGFEVKTPPQKP